MQLLLAHQILIGAALGLAGIFGMRAAVGFARRGQPVDLVLAIGSLAVGIGLALYFRKVRARWNAAKNSPDRPG
ncbi:MAG: hypothetical protein U0359_25825 [Byssovorax sp.]